MASKYNLKLRQKIRIFFSCKRTSKVKMPLNHTQSSFIGGLTFRKVPFSNKKFNMAASKWRYNHVKRRKIKIT